MPLAAWLLALVPGLVSRVLVALGISAVTITGVSAVLGAVKNQFIDGMYALPSGILDVFLLSGGGVGLGMIFGAFTTRLVMDGVQDSLKFFGTNTG